MANFFNPEGKDGKTDLRLHAPATARNHEAIFDVLKPALPHTGLIFEVASGTGEHAFHMAPNLPDHIWQPTDIETSHLASIDAWRNEITNSNIRRACYFNVLEQPFETDENQQLAAIVAINLIHISPWVVTEALLHKAGQALKQDSVLYMYGPYRRDGKHTSESNAQFDQSLRSRNESWGVRDMEAVLDLATKKGFSEPDIIQMPANNFSLVFKKLA